VQKLVLAARANSAGLTPAQLATINADVEVTPLHTNGKT